MCDNEGVPATQDPDARLAIARRGLPLRRKAEEVADGLADVMAAFPGAFDGADRDAVGVIRSILDGIAEGDFFPTGLR